MRRLGEPDVAEAFQHLDERREVALGTAFMPSRAIGPTIVIGASFATVLGRCCREQKVKRCTDGRRSAIEQILYSIGSADGGRVLCGLLPKSAEMENCVAGQWGRGRWALVVVFLLLATACTGKKRPFGDGPLSSDPNGPGASGASGEMPLEPSPADTDTTNGGSDQESAPAGAELDRPVGAVLGTACARDLECGSGFCVDGVCCDTRCGELCATCAAPGAVGTCAPAPNDEACGQLACPGGTECRGYDQAQLEQNCAGFGECRAGIECASLDQPEGTTCQSSTGACDGLGECIVPGKARLGATCTQDTDCGEGHCVARGDGTSVCCDSACDGVCEQCSAAGRCTEARATDERCAAVDCPDDNVCRDYPEALTESLCRGFGQCKTLLECPFEALRVAAACECDAEGNCSLARGQPCTNETECGLAACAPSLSGTTICCTAGCGNGLSCSNDGSRCVECEGSDVRCDGTVEQRCTGEALEPTNCANGCTPGVGCNAQAPVGFRCDNVACQAGSVCQRDVAGLQRCCSRDCAAEGKLCAENGSCVCPEGGGQDLGQSCLLQVGEPCGPNTAACETGLTCVDGVCCTEACSGACESCNVAGSVGQCVFASRDTSSCAAGEQCVSRGQCRLGAGGSCGGNDARCVSNNCESQLNGNGATICCGEACSGRRASCSRDGARCVECEGNGDCPNGCQNGLCNPRRTLGELCDVAAQCESGNCTVIPNTNTRRCCGNCQGGQVCNASGGCECPQGQVLVNGQCRKVGGQTCSSNVECQSGNCESSVDGQNRCCAADCGDPATRRCATNGSSCIDQRGGIGTPCDANSDCIFGNCFDGVCCDGPCGAVCERCNAAGQCVADSLPTGCAAGLQCFGRGRCRVPIGGDCSTTACGEGICTETTSGGDVVCCSGDCPDARPLCASNGIACIECLGANDCGAGEECDQGQCVRVLSPPEDPCTNDGECATGACVETYLDNDGDGFALQEAVNTPQRFCTRAPAGRTTLRPINQQTTDCCDVTGGGQNFRPNQTTASATGFAPCARAGDPNGFDRNCSGAATSTGVIQNRQRNCNDTSVAPCTSRGGWVAPVSCGGSETQVIPECGDTGCVGPCSPDQDGVCVQRPGGPAVRGPCL